MGAYTALLSIAVKHNFFTDGACPCLNFHPTEQTQHLLENAGLLQKKTASGVQIVYNRNRLEALKLFAEDSEEPLCLAFKVYSSDPYFKSYTEPFADIAEGMLYFDNRAVTPDRSEMALSASKTVSGADIVAADSAALADVINHRDRLLPPVFVLKIFAETEQGSHLTRWLEPEPAVYSVGFNARQTQWKYFLLGKLATTGSYISDPDNRIEFDALGETALPDHRIALAFRSRQMIPLNERYDFRFQLKRQGVGGGSILINRLPVASITQTGREVVADQRTIVSEIYINS